MNWLEQIITAILKFLNARANEPKTLDNAQTPQPVRSRWDAWVLDRLREAIVSAIGKGQGTAKPEPAPLPKSVPVPEPEPVFVAEPLPVPDPEPLPAALPLPVLLRKDAAPAVKRTMPFAALLFPPSPPFDVESGSAGTAAAT